MTKFPPRRDLHDTVILHQTLIQTLPRARPARKQHLPPLENLFYRAPVSGRAGPGPHGSRVGCEQMEHLQFFFFLRLSATGE